MPNNSPAAPIQKKPAPKFSPAGKDVKQGALTIARAVSQNMATRISNALNQYTPDRRGQ